jgi:hypothetical protein
MDEPRLIVMRLTSGSTFEGQWIEVDRPEIIVQRPGHPDGDVAMVPTGDLEWDGDRCAEVWVPQDALPLWLAEHQVDEAPRRTMGER